MNQHPPTDSWLKVVANDGHDGFVPEPDVGDKGEITLERPSGEYNVKVTKISDA